MSIDVRHVCTLLQVFDMPTAIRFYRDILGFEVVKTSPRNGDQFGDQFGDHFDWGMLRLGDTHVMLNTAYEAHERPACPEPGRVSAHQDTCLYFGCPDPDAVYEHLRKHGVAVQPPMNAPYGMRQLHVTDPDGYGLCFQWPAA